MHGAGVALGAGGIFDVTAKEPELRLVASLAAFPGKGVSFRERTGGVEFLASGQLEGRYPDEKNQRQRDGKGEFPPPKAGRALEIIQLRDALRQAFCGAFARHLSS